MLSIKLLEEQSRHCLIDFVMCTAVLLLSIQYQKPVAYPWIILLHEMYMYMEQYLLISKYTYETQNRL